MFKYLRDRRFFKFEFDGQSIKLKKQGICFINYLHSSLRIFLIKFTKIH